MDPTNPLDELTFFAAAAPLAAVWYFGINHLVSGLRHIRTAYPPRELASGRPVRCPYVRFGYGSPFYFARVTIDADGLSMAPPPFCLRWRTSFFVPWSDLQVAGRRLVLARLPEIAIVVWPSLARRLAAERAAAQ